MTRLSEVRNHPGTEKETKRILDTKTKRRRLGPADAVPMSLDGMRQFLFSEFLFWSLAAGAGGCSFMPSLKPRMASARPLPNSGSFLGPNNTRAMSATMSQCHGENSPTKTSQDAAGTSCRLQLGYGTPQAMSNPRRVNILQRRSAAGVCFRTRFPNLYTWPLSCLR
jgi:hypothetical protein